MWAGSGVCRCRGVPPALLRASAAQQPPSCPSLPPPLAHSRRRRRSRPRCPRWPRCSARRSIPPDPPGTAAAPHRCWLGQSPSWQSAAGRRHFGSTAPARPAGRRPTGTSSCRHARAPISWCARPPPQHTAPFLARSPGRTGPRCPGASTGLHSSGQARWAPATGGRARCMACLWSGRAPGNPPILSAPRAVPGRAERRVLLSGRRRQLASSTAHPAAEVVAWDGERDRLEARVELLSEKRERAAVDGRRPTTGANSDC